jgi:hypothetical protein
MWEGLNQANYTIRRRQQITARPEVVRTRGRLHAGRQRLDVDPDPSLEHSEASMFPD